MKDRLDQAVVALFRKLGLPSPDLDSRRRELRDGRRELDRLTLEQHDGAALPEPLQYDSIERGRRAQLIVYQTMWLQEMARRLVAGRGVSTTDFVANLANALPPDAVHEETRQLMILLQSTLKSFAEEFNQITGKIPTLAQMNFSSTDVRDVKEPVKGKRQYGLVPKGATPKSTAPISVTYMRARVSTPSWSLTMRGARGRIEFYLVPASELFLLSQSETPMRLKSVIRLNERIGPGIWTIDGLPADPDELFYLCRSMFKNLVFAAAQNMKEEVDQNDMLQNLEGEALRATVRELLVAEQNMAQKIVSQQEEIQNRIARDLHDAVIADIMTLKRSLSSDDEPEAQEISQTLDSVCQRIREICHDLTPRDLRDWGLQTVIEDLLERVAQRTGADCSLECEKELPEFPFAVQLHLFRIVQECLNNIEKYSEASRVIVKFDVTDSLVRLSMHDNGRGFAAAEQDARRAREGGTGLSGIRERAEMIRCFYPTKLKVETAPGKGYSTILEMRL
jgi:signal transduction histidine kinase